MTVRGPFAAALLVLLVLSLGINLLIAGFVLARVTGPRPGGGIERIVALGVRAFPPSVREEIAARSRAEREALETRLQRVQEARRDMFEAMRAEPFDRQQLQRAYEELNAATAELQRAGQAIVIDVLAETPADIRQEIRDRRRRRQH